MYHRLGRSVLYRDTVSPSSRLAKWKRFGEFMTSQADTGITRHCLATRPETASSISCSNSATGLIDFVHGERGCVSDFIHWMRNSPSPMPYGMISGDLARGVQ
jgi:hypothetical protein